MLVASIAFAYSGFAALCLAMRKQYNSVFKTWSSKPPQWLLRLVGVVLFVISLSLCIAMWGATVGMSAYWIVLAIPAFVIVLVNTYVQKFFIQIALLALIIGLICGVCGAVF
jgi:uncharacterized membrane protein YhaH (DUF805 family)